MMLRPIKWAFRLPSIMLSVLLASAIGVAVLLKHWRKIAAADLVMVHPTGGFGYTITSPDILRRDRAGQRIVILFAYIPGTHNRFIGRIWPDIDLLFIPISFRRPFVRQFHPDDEHARTVALFPYWNPWRYILFALIHAMLRLVLPAGRVITDDNYYRAIPDFRIPAKRPPLDQWHPFYFRLIRDVPAKPLRLPETNRRVIASALRRAAGGERKLCCLYLRLRASKDLPDAYLRSGSDVAAYLRAVRRLTERGYQVLLVGDRSLPPGMADDFAGMFVDAASLNVSEQIFYLYAATESDIAIGECGGGFWIGPINGIPSMMINNYPFHTGWHEMAIHFKVLQGSDGNLIPAESIFSQYGEEIVHTDPKVLENGAAELEAAITHFADCVESGTPFGVPAMDVPGMKAHFWSAEGRSYISPVWLELYDTDRPLPAEGREARAEEILRRRAT